MSARLSTRLRLLQRHLRSLVWVWVWVWYWVHWHPAPRTRSPSSRHPPFTHYPFPPRSLVYGGQTSPHKPRLVVSHSTCPPLSSSSPHAHSFVLGTAVINNNKLTRLCDAQTSPQRPRVVVFRSTLSHTCPPLSPFHHANSFVIGTAVINTHTLTKVHTGPGHWHTFCTRERLTTFCRRMWKIPHPLPRDLH
jgi:hypothetical protein